MKADIYLLRDVRQRIGSGLIRYKNEPYVVLDVIRDDSQVIVTSLDSYSNGTSEMKTVNVNDPELDVSAIELGYINTKTNGALLLSRGPDRRYRQLTSPDNLTIFSPAKDRDETRNLNRTAILYSAGAVDMFNNVYPTIRDAMILMNSGKIHSVAVSRDVALTIDQIKMVKVYVKDMQIGYIEPNQSNTIRVIVPECEYGSLISEFLYGYDWRVE